MISSHRRTAHFQANDVGVIYQTECTWPGSLNTQRNNWELFKYVGYSKWCCTDIDRNNQTSSKRLKKSQMYGYNVLPAYAARWR